MPHFLEYISRPVAVTAIAVICFTSLSLMLQASFGDSAIMDELAHIPAGYGYARELDFRLNPEHPPLVKALAAFPLLFTNVNFPTEHRAWTTDINGQWEMGVQFLYYSGNDADQIIRLSRIGPMLLTLLLILLIYLWSRELLGALWALLPAFFFALSPTVLAHGHYVTTDIAAAFGAVLATYFFLKFLACPSRRHLLYAGLTFGVAELTKFSNALLVPYFFLLILVFFFISVFRDWSTVEDSRLRRFVTRGFRYLRATFFIFAIGTALVIYPVYALFTLGYPLEKQVRDTEFILGSFAGGPPQESEFCSPTRCLAELNIWMAKHSLTRPLAEYVLGVLMVLQRSAGGNTGYFLGEVSATGSPWYFPVVYPLKEPIPLLLFVLVALSLSAKDIARSFRGGLQNIGDRLLVYLTAHFTEFAFISFIIIYWAWSIQSPLNIGFRHLLPTLPFLYMLAAGRWRRWIITHQHLSPRSAFEVFKLHLKMLFSFTLKTSLLLILLLWFTVETFAAAPHFLSFFNGFAGGIFGKDAWSGYRYVTDSNYDWGQDLLRLKKFVDSHPEIDKIAVDYFGGGNPKYYLGKAENWWSSRGNPAKENIHWLAVSVNTLQGATQPLHPGQRRNPEDEYRWLTALRTPKPGLGNVPEPDFRAGTSIFIYKL